MATSLAELIAEAKKLSRKQRARLARELYLSFVYHLEAIERACTEKVFRRAHAQRRGTWRRLYPGDQSGRRMM
jgi:hypothetical protein